MSSPLFPSTVVSSVPLFPSTVVSSVPLFPSTVVSSVPLFPSTVVSSVPLFPSTVVSSSPLYPSTVVSPILSSLAVLIFSVIFFLPFNAFALSLYAYDSFCLLISSIAFLAFLPVRLPMILGILKTKNNVTDTRNITPQAIAAPIKISLYVS